MTALVLVGPAAAAVVAAVKVFTGVSPVPVLVAAGLYVVSGLGITGGFHRMLTHRSFVAVPWLRALFTVAGMLAWQGSPSGWVANHRVHHLRSDQPGDPHSPHAGPDPEGPGVAGWRGFLRAHFGWLFTHSGADPEEWATDVLADPVTGPLDRWFGLVAAAGLVVPALLVWPFTSLSVALWTFVFSVGRVALLSHVTWSINSICHLVGSRPFRSKDQAANVAWLALFSFGESWHNTHHAFPRAARVGVDRFQVDVTGRLISVLERAGFVSQVHQPARHVLESRRR